MCSGRVDPTHILRAFLNGMDAVFIGGCRLNECNYVTQGNYHALNMVLLYRKILSHAGLNPDRLRIEFMSSGEGDLFTETVNEYGKQVRELGPLGTGEGLEPTELRPRLEEINYLVPYIKMAKKEKLRTRIDKEEDYDEFYTIEEIDRLFKEAPSYYIDPEQCEACMICLRKCYVDAITGGKNQIHVIDQDKCIKCKACFDVCPPRFGAVREMYGEPVPPSIPEEERIVVRKNKKQKESTVSS